MALQCHPSDVPDFQQLLTECSYPTFVAMNGVLVGWSASGPAPTESEMADTSAERLSQTALGRVFGSAAGEGTRGGADVRASGTPLWH